MIAVIVICDDCGVHGDPGSARDAMQHLGWTYYDRDRCPECSSLLFSG